MIAVTCSACRLRFEAAPAERRIHGADIVCPACDAGEPIVLDVAERCAAETSSKPKTVRKKVTPPPLDLSRGFADPTLAHAAIARASLRGPDFDPGTLSPDTFDAVRGPSPLVKDGDGVVPIYVDFDEPIAPSPAARRGLLVRSGLLAACVAFFAAALAGPLNPFPFGPSTTVSPDALLAAAPSSEDDRLVTAGISKVALRPAAVLTIARVSTELAETDDGRVLSVRTDLRNEGDATVAAPPLRISIRSDDGTVLHRWTHRSADTSVASGETRAFTATTSRIPAGAGDVKVDFAER